MGISEVQRHQGRGISTVDGFGAIFSGNFNLTKACGHDAQTEDTTVEHTDSKTKGIDISTTVEARIATKVHTIGVGELHFVDEAKASDVRIESVKTTNIGDIGTPPSITACPRVDKQLGGTGSTSTLVVTGPDGLGRHKHQKGYYSEYSKYVFHFCHFLSYQTMLRIHRS